MELCHSQMSIYLFVCLSISVQILLFTDNLLDSEYLSQHAQVSVINKRLCSRRVCRLQENTQRVLIGIFASILLAGCVVEFICFKLITFMVTPSVGSTYCILLE